MPLQGPPAGHVPSHVVWLDCCSAWGYGRLSPPPNFPSHYVQGEPFVNKISFLLIRTSCFQVSGGLSLLVGTLLLLLLCWHKLRGEHSSGRKPGPLSPGYRVVPREEAKSCETSREQMWTITMRTACFKVTKPDEEMKGRHRVAPALSMIVKGCDSDCEFIQMYFNVSTKPSK